MDWIDRIFIFVLFILIILFTQIKFSLVHKELDYVNKTMEEFKIYYGTKPEYKSQEI